MSPGLRCYIVPLLACTSLWQLQAAAGMTALQGLLRAAQSMQAAPLYQHYAVTTVHDTYHWTKPCHHESIAQHHSFQKMPI